MCDVFPLGARIDELSDSLVWSFRKTAGLKPAGNPYGGWERPDCELIYSQQNNPPNLRGKKCKIFDWLCTSKLVGEGEIETDDPMHLVDGISIGGGAYLVYVERVFEPNAFLWRNQNN
ncbi:hypothetical protein Sjap_019560 [Stephania japonica]|uniref:Uncharacterized protein n=1 Tax=Stephania japonica TaxID=461633 RepID=A0AAP0EZ14_9MAGN